MCGRGRGRNLEQKRHEQDLTSADPINRDIVEGDDSRRWGQRQIRRGFVLEEVTSLAVVATVGYLDLLTIHVILSLMVSHPLAVRVVPVDSLQKKNEIRERDAKSDWPVPKG